MFLAHGMVDFVLASKIENSGDVSFVSFLIGVSTAQLSLTATWAVFADRPLVSRLLSTGYQIYAMGLALLLGFYVHRQGMASRTNYQSLSIGLDWQSVGLTVLLLLPAVFITIAAFRLLRSLIRDPRLTMPEQRAVLATAQQTHLRHFLRDVGIVCVLLAVTRSVLPNSGPLKFDGWAATAALLVLHGTIAGLLLTPPVLGVCFFPRQWGMRRGLLALLLWPVVIAFAMHWSFDYFGMHVSNHGVTGTALFCAGTVVSYGISAAVMRSVGFEMRFHDPVSSNDKASLHVS